MSFYRISTSQMIQNGLNGIYKNQAAMNDAISEISTGKKANLDPLSEALSMSYKVSLSNNQQNNLNIDTIKPKIQEQEISLRNINSSLLSLSEIAVSVANPLNSEEKKAYQYEYDAIKQNIMTQLNSKDSMGEYQFSGYSSRITPFDNNLNYFGDQGTNQIRIGNSSTITLNTPGNQIVTQNLKDTFAKFESFFNGQPLDTSVIKDVQDSQGDINNQLSNLGGRLNTLDLMKTYNTDLVNNNSAQISQLEDADIAKAASDLSNATNALQASLKTQVTLQNLSIFNYI